MLVSAAIVKLYVVLALVALAVLAATKKTPGR